MLFNSLPFLLFFPTFLVLYFLSRGRARMWICVAASYLFYAWWDWRFLAVLIGSTALDFLIGLRLGMSSEPRLRRILVLVSVTANLGLLGFFKYFHFFADSFVRASSAIGLAVNEPFLQIILPVGISFYTFQSLSYTLDVYWRHIDVEHDFARYAAFVAFWPQLVAGPIVRARHLLPQLRRDHRFDGHAFVVGLHLMIWGFFKKVVIADSLAAVVDARFATPGAHGTLSLLVGVGFYAFQIYCDFSGYSDIAIGAARVLGFDFGLNFDKPYFSRSFSEFWTRWHISLSSWLRDYLYIPLGGNRNGTIATYRNLMIVMLLGGLWHGANWTFVLWGTLHGVFLIAQRLTSNRYRRMAESLGLPEPVRAALAVSTVFVLTCFAWIFFRASSVGVALDIIGRIFTTGALWDTRVPMAFDVAKGLFVIGVLLASEVIGSRPRVRGALNGSVWPRLALASAMLWGIVLFGTFAGARFIYFQF